MWALIAAAFAAQVALQLLQKRRLKAQLNQAEENVKIVSDERRSERAGRTKAERSLRELQLKLAQQTADNDAAGSSASDGPNLLQVAFPMRPVGILRSCFAKRNGTPRQPLLVPAARARLTLRPDIAGDFLEGIAQYSHCWLLYVFHMNTDLQRLWQAGKNGAGFKGKIRVPRLDGGKLGVFATRSPHRPCPIGLSVAEVIGVEGNTLILGGADVVDGSPILDIKPYVPFCDSVPTAAAPGWVAARAADLEPLDVGDVHISEQVDRDLEAGWQRVAAGADVQLRALYPRFEDFRELVVQVLSRDVRSVTQRIKVPLKAKQGQAALTLQGGVEQSHPGLVPQLGGSGNSSSSGGGGSSSSTACKSAVDGEEQPGGSRAAAAAEGTWHVVLAGVDISYDVEDEESGRISVILRTASALR